MTTKTINLPKLENARSFKDYLIDLVETLSEATGYNFDDLNEKLFACISDREEDETVEDVLNYFIDVTLEKDW